jgi:hypothetical protein
MDSPTSKETRQLYNGHFERLPQFNKNQQSENISASNNNCRYYKCRGTNITKYSFGGRNSRTTENPRKSIHEWPQQPRPGPKAWKAWREALQLKLSVDEKSRRLRQPLGKLTTSRKNTQQERNWYYDTKTGELIQRQGTKFGTHKATTNATQFEEP